MTEQMALRGVSIDWSEVSEDSYLHEIPAIRSLERLEFRERVAFFVGENGSGKSTLLEAIAVAGGFNAEGGTRNYAFSTYDSHSELSRTLRLIRGPKRAAWGYFLRAESFYNVATAEENYAELPEMSAGYHRQSHGESFLSVVQRNLRPGGLYLFDEPEAALSPQRQLTLLCEVYRAAREGAQFVIATHSPILLGLPGAEIFSFDGGMVRECAYDEVESVQVMKLFMNRREQILRALLEE